jgi:hypothetical protein
MSGETLGARGVCRGLAPASATRNGPSARARWGRGPSSLVGDCQFAMSVCLYGDGWTLVWCDASCLSEMIFAMPGGPDRCLSRVPELGPSPRLVASSRHARVTRASRFPPFLYCAIAVFPLSFYEAPARAPWILECMLPVKAIVGTNI